jgi:hypothetical protein
MVALGNGDGTFAAAKPVRLPVGNFGNFGRFAICDVNKDGKLDLIVTAGNGTSSNIAVLLGNGDGTFQPGIVSAGPTSNLNFINLQPRMAIADFDGDGAVDIVIADTLNDTVSLLLGDNHGHFTLKTTIPNAQSAIEIYPGDFNGDGHMDFLARGYLSNEVHVWINNGDATFKLPVGTIRDSGGRRGRPNGQRHRACRPALSGNAHGNHTIPTGLGLTFFRNSRLCCLGIALRRYFQARSRRLLVHR